MSFLQIIDLHTKHFDDLQALEDEWRTATEGTRTLRHSYLTRDRNDPDHYMILAFFDSYESAMENSALPATSTFAEKQMPLLDGAPMFSDLEILQDRD